MAQIVPPPDFAKLCTLRLGGSMKRFYKTTDCGDLTTAVAAADRSHVELLMLGGGSNLVPPDAMFEGLVVQDARTNVSVVNDPMDWPSDVDLPKDFPNPAGFPPGTVLLRADAGVIWDRLVEYTVAQGLSGIEMLSGIPGTVGAAPVQNIGAYGGEVAGALLGVVAWDRQLNRVCYLSRATLGLGYRDSILKRSRASWGATGRWIVLEVDLILRRSDLSVPVVYGQLAGHLGVETGARVPLSQLRAAVLDLRRSKGMILDPADHDTWSVGSFFVNPVVALAAPVLARLTPEAPRWPVANAGAVKLSAAWLIGNSGIEKGFALPGSRAAVSSKHVLALTNLGGATAAQIRELGDYVIAQVNEHFGLTLVPEPVML